MTVDLNTMSLTDLEALAATIAAKKAEAAEARKTARAEALEAVNGGLQLDSEALLTDGVQYALVVVPAQKVAATEAVTNESGETITPAIEAHEIPAHLKIVVREVIAAVAPTVNRRIERAALSGFRQTSSRVIVDGEEYNSYREAYDALGYTWNGRHPSFNARYELARLNHAVGLPTR
jgi:hypothetical protein